MLTNDILSKLNPLTFPLQESHMVQKTLEEAILFLKTENICFDERSEVFKLFSSYITIFQKDPSFLKDFTHFFEKESDFLVINLLKNTYSFFSLEEELIETIFKSYSYKSSLLHLLNSNIYNKTIIVGKHTSLSLWEWLYEKTNGVFFTGKYADHTNKQVLHRHLYNNFYYNKNYIDKYLLFLSTLNILISNSLLDKDDLNLQTIGNLYFEKEYAYYSHLNDNFMKNIFFPDYKKDIIFAELFSIIHNDFYTLFKKDCYIITYEFASHIISLNSNIYAHQPSLKYNLVSNLEKEFLMTLSEKSWFTQSDKKKKRI